MANPETKVSAFVYDKNKKMQCNTGRSYECNYLSEDMKKAIQDGKGTMYNSEWKKLELTEDFFSEEMTRNFYLDKEKEGSSCFPARDLAPYSEGVTYVVVSSSVVK